MESWIVTGGAASGKSLFCQMLSELCPEAVLFNSDLVVHSLLARETIASVLLSKCGPEVIAADGTVSRPALREKVFADASLRRKLEEILHPHVLAALTEMRDNLAEARNRQLLIAEIPLFYESSRDFPADLVIVVATGSTMQRERLTGPRGLDLDTAERIRAAQWPLSRKLEHADKVIWNEGSRALLKLQAQQLLLQLNAP